MNINLKLNRSLGAIWTRQESKQALKEIQETAARKKALALEKKEGA